MGHLKWGVLSGRLPGERRARGRREHEREAWERQRQPELLSGQERICLYPANLSLS